MLTDDHPEMFDGQSERGQSLVELAISLTVMLMLLAGAVTFGMALFSYVAIRDAAQEGALYGSFNPQDAGGAFNLAAICNHVKASSSSPLNLSTFYCQTPTQKNNITVTALGNDCEGTSDGTAFGVPNAIQVTVEYDYPIIMPYIGGIINSQTIHLTASATDTVLQPRCP